MWQIFTGVIGFVSTVLEWAFVLPALRLPARFWNSHHHAKQSHALFAWLPSVALTAAVWVHHLRPGQTGGRLRLWEDLLLARALPSVYQCLAVRDAWLSHLTSFEAVVLVGGATLWVELMLASTLFLGPIHLRWSLEDGSARLGAQRLAQVFMPVARLGDRARAHWAACHGVWFVGARRRHLQPLIVNAPVTTWILGGKNRREATLPLLAAVKPRIMQGSPLVWIDTAPRSLVWSHLEMWALKAGRELDVRRVDVNPRNAESFTLDLEDIEATRAIVYIAVHLREADHDVEEALQEVLFQVAHLANQKRSYIAEPLVVVLQDADAMPAPLLRQLARGTSVHTYLASRTLSAEQSVAVRDVIVTHTHHVLLLLQGVAERCEGLLEILHRDGLSVPSVPLSRHGAAWVVTARACSPDELVLRVPPEVEHTS